MQEIICALPLQLMATVSVNHLVGSVNHLVGRGNFYVIHSLEKAHLSLMLKVVSHQEALQDRHRSIGGHL